MMMFSFSLIIVSLIIGCLIGLKMDKNYQERMNKIMSGDTSLSVSEFCEQFYSDDLTEKQIGREILETLSDATGYNIELLRPSDNLSLIWPDIYEDLVYRLEHALQVKIPSTSQFTFDEIVKLAANKTENLKKHAPL